MKRLAELIIILLIPAMSGCLYGKVSPVGVEPSAKYMRSGGYEVLGEAEGVSSSFTLFWVFPVTPDEDISKAVDEAIRSLGGDNLIEAVFYREKKVYIVGTVNIVRAKGKVIRYK